MAKKELQILTFEALNRAPSIEEEKNKSNDHLVEEIFKKFPRNNKIEEITAKVLLLNLAYSSNLHFHFSDEFTIFDFVKGIAQIQHLDIYLKSGNEKAVEAILNISNHRNFFSFASKYCFAHNHYVYGGDAFSIYDSSVEKFLPKYADCTRTQLETWRKKKAYASFNRFITDYLKSTGIQTENIKFKFDRFLWNQRKGNKS